MTGCVHLVFKVTPNFLRERHPHPSSQSGHPPKWPKFLAIFGAEGKILTPPPKCLPPHVAIFGSHMVSGEWPL